MIKVYLPELGENITKATISYWYAEEGASVVEGTDLVEVATDKATFNVPAPCSGTLVEVVAHEGDTVHPGEVLAAIEEDTVSDDKTEE
ncbi:MAG TPA: biotin attachment protein [Candidatus Omnitrophica bacterium]|nr:biotin attachment protein [Candidatus Omnitrophota bacterium]